MSLWWRHLFFGCLRALGAILAAIAALYIVIDFTVHGKLFAQTGIPVIRYYAAQLAYRAPFLLPLALLLATLKSILSLQHHRELLALRAAGLRLAKLLSPYLAIALLVALGLYLNYQFAFPSVCQLLDRSAHKTFSGKEGTHALQLSDGSTLLYQRYNKAEHKLFDCYWIRSDKELYRMKTLFPHTDPPLATYVDHLQRSDDGQLAVAEHFVDVALPNLSFADHSPFLPAEAHPPTHLMQRRPQTKGLLGDREAEWISQLHAKLALPWLGVLIVLAVAPLLAQYARELPVAAIYACGLLGFLSLQTGIDVILLLEANHVLPPAVGIWTLLGGLMAIVSFRLVRHA